MALNVEAAINGDVDVAALEVPSRHGIENGDVARRLGGACTIFVSPTARHELCDEAFAVEAAGRP